MSLRILVVGNGPQVATGYGVQVKLMTPRFAGLGHKPAILAYFGVQGGSINWNGIPVFPGHAHQYGQDAVASRGAMWQADVVIPLMDLWVCRFEAYGGLPVAAYFPLDSDNVPKSVLSQASLAYRRIVMAHYGERLLRELGMECTYIPHMVDSKAFYPMSRDEARDTLRLATQGVSHDTFMVGMVAANVGYPSRKAFWEQFCGFKRFHDRHPDSVLYVHSHVALHGEQGGPCLPEMARYAGIPHEAIMFPDPQEYLLGYSDDQMRTLYNACDVLLHVTRGEGCGATALESAMCGTPAISGGWSAMPEHNYHGWIVPVEMAQRDYTPLGVCQWVPRIEGIDEALEQAYDGARSETRKRKAAQEAKANHDADMVASKHWGKFLRNLEHDLREDGLLYHQRVARAQQEAEAEPVADIEAAQEQLRRDAEREGSAAGRSLVAQSLEAEKQQNLKARAAAGAGE